MLLGSLPLNRRIQLDGGRSAWLDCDVVDEWAGGLRSRPVPVLLHHDVDQIEGWCDKAVLNADRCLLFGQLVQESTARLIRTKFITGLSPGVRVHAGQPRYYRAVGRWGEGEVLSFPELSIVWQPQIENARWLGA